MEYSIDEEVYVITSISQLNYSRIYSTKIKGFVKENNEILYHFEHGYPRHREDIFKTIDEAKAQIRFVLEEHLSTFN